MLKNSYSLLSIYRTELMGVAIMWVYFFHSGIHFNGSLAVLNYVKKTGFGGVDIFLFLSGLGLYFSLQKKEKLSAFFKKRLIRIIPTYWAIISLFSLYLFISKGMLFSTFLFELSTIGFWINKGSFDWYVPSILALYFIFPFFFSAFEKNNKVVILVLTILFAIVISIAAIALNLNYLLIFTTRIPVFFIGAFYANMIDAKKMPSNAINYFNLALVTLGFGVLFFIAKTFSVKDVWAYGLFWYPFAFIAPSISMLLVKVISWMATTKFGLLIRFFRYCGKYSLEIYLLHGLIFRLQNKFGSVTYVLKEIDPSQSIEYVIYFLITLLLAYPLSYAVNNATNLLTKKNVVYPINYSLKNIGKKIAS